MTLMERATRPYAALAVAGIAAAASVWMLARAVTNSPDDPAIWLAESRGVLRVAAETAAADFEIPLQAGGRAVAADRTRGTVWMLSQRTLLAYDRAGAFLFSQEVPGPQGEPAALVVDAVSGVVWLALQSQIRAYDPTGQNLLERGLAKPVSATALDSRRSRFWFAVGDTLEALDESGALAVSQRLAGIKAISTMAYSVEADQFWVVADGKLFTVTPEAAAATLVSQQKGFKDFTAIDANGVGGLWAIDKKTLYALNGTGSIIHRLRLFQNESPEQLVGLAANPADGSVWVASTHGVAHVSADGSIRIRGTPDPGDSKTRVIQSVHLETGAALPRIEILAPANNSLLNTAQPTLRLSYSGADLDLDSIALTANDNAIAATCNALPGTADCVPDQPLADGGHDIAATIANASGDASEPALVRLIIDTTPPVITVTSPPNGFLTNNSSLTIAGAVSEASNLTINRNPVALQDLQFSFGPVTLAEGSNTFVLRAIDPAGNVGTLSIAGVLDTIPPTAPVESLIEIIVSGEQATVAGGPGSVEGNARITVTNLTKDLQVVVTANADGSFSATIAASFGDKIQIHATDAAQNQGSETTIEIPLPPGFEPLELAVTSPFSGAAIPSDTVLVTGTFRGPTNAGVSVNGAPAALVPTASGWSFYAETPLQLGGNEIVVKAAAPDGRTESRSITVLSTDSRRYSVQASPHRGFGPLKVNFQVSDLQLRGIIQIAVDFDSNGTTDFVATDPTQPITFTYTGLGLRTATFTIFDKNGLGHRQSVYIVLLDHAQVDQTLRAVWSELTAALAASDPGRALSLFPEDSRATYAGVFEALAPHMNEVLADFSEIEQVQLGTDSGTYALMTLSGGRPRVYFVQFILDGDGIWRIDSL